MANSKYARSAGRERQTVHEHRRQGWFAVRTPGSKSAVDVVALRHGECHLIQIKTGGTPFSGFPPHEREALLEAAARAGGLPLYHHYPLRARKPDIYGAEQWPDAG